MVLRLRFPRNHKGCDYRNPSFVWRSQSAQKGAGRSFQQQEERRRPGGRSLA